MIIPPITKRASKPMKAKRTPFAMACQVPDLAWGEGEVVASDQGIFVDSFSDSAGLV